jgi:hypothetical protein
VASSESGQTWVWGKLGKCWSATYAVTHISSLCFPWIRPGNSNVHLAFNDREPCSPQLNPSWCAVMTTFVSPIRSRPARRAVASGSVRVLSPRSRIPLPRATTIIPTRHQCEDRRYVSTADKPRARPRTAIFFPGRFFILMLHASERPSFL